MRRCWRRAAGCRFIWSPNVPQKRCPTPSLRRVWSRCAKSRPTGLRRRAGRLAAAGRGCRRNQRAGQRGHADPHRRRHGCRGRDPGRAQRRPLQRQVPARVGRQHLLDPGRRRARRPRRPRPRCAPPGCRCWPPRWTARRASTRPGSCSASRRRGCSGPNHTVCPPKSPTRPITACASRCPAARRA